MMLVLGCGPRNAPSEGTLSIDASADATAGCLRATPVRDCAFFSHHESGNNIPDVLTNIPISFSIFFNILQEKYKKIYIYIYIYI